MKLTLEEIAAIRRRISYESSAARSCVADLTDHIAAVEAERDAARKLIEEMRALQREGAEKPG